MTDKEKQEEFIDKEWVNENRSQFAHTWDWDEHPEGYEGECYCLSCRQYSQS